VSTKREREYARRRHEKWQAHLAARAARERRNRRLAGWALAAIGVAVVAWVVIAQLTAGPDAAAEATAQETPAAVAPDPSLAEGRTWTVQLTTTAGELTLELDGAAAPQAVASFLQLSREGFFDATTCHRLTVTDPLYVLQCGDPTGTGTGGPDYRFGPVENAPTDGVYPAGTVAMARTKDDGSSMGSQFFLVYQDSTIPDDAAGGYTVFGRVTEGLDVLQQVADAGVESGTETPVTQVTIEKVETQ
jgi:peptidyl-prolyl cis-trans isomerase B (cyclophilin B)